MLAPDAALDYEYDMGDTTPLTVKALRRYVGILKPKILIVILARNQAPANPCDACGRHPAVHIRQECQWNGGGWLCESCASRHGCEKDFLVPVVNSPRTGACGYMG